ncbi:MAG: WYL domain-containing protein [Oscillospiraceae bacterium]|nr:WYL domain-containing protein [Oscillospiraceae bacterium]
MFEPRPKIKLLMLQKILLENTDPEHSLSGNDIIRILGEYGINVERKSVYDDIDTLVQSGMDIVTERRGHANYYYVNSRTFQDEELMILVNTVASSKFLTKKKSDELISKLKTLTSKYQAQSLSRTIYVDGRSKSNNERIYYSINAIHEAIVAGKQITFHYTEYDITLKRKYRRGGQLYAVSPIYLISDSDYYYLTAYNPQHDDISNFRIDKMADVSISDEPRVDLSPEQIERAKELRTMFGAFARESSTVTLKMTNKPYVIGVLVDKYGSNLRINRTSEDKFTVRLEAQISPAFYAWLFSFGEDAEVVEPEWVRNEAKGQIEKMMAVYKA